jgi:hypothetical protein
MDLSAVRQKPTKQEPGPAPTSRFTKCELVTHYQPLVEYLFEPRRANFAEHPKCVAPIHAPIPQYCIFHHPAKPFKLKSLAELSHFDRG